MGEKEEQLFCVFCDKNRDEVKHLVASPNGLHWICDECVELCSLSIEQYNDARIVEEVDGEGSEDRE